MNKKWVAALSVACGVVAAGGLYLRDQSGHAVVRIIVASRDIPGREILQEADLKEVMVPAAAVDKSAVQDESQLVGKMLLSAVYAGEQIRPQRVKPSPLELAPDEEAIAIQSDLVASVGGLLQAGDVADVFLTVPVPNTKRVEVYKIGAAVRVLSVRDTNARATGPRANSDPAKQAGVPAVVVLKVQSDQAPALRKVSQLGVITFAQVSPASEIPDKPVFNIPDLTGLVSTMAPVAPTAPSSTPPQTSTGQR